MKKSTAASKSSPNASNYYNLRLAGFTPESLVDGEGLRATIFLSGCPHHCPECHNPEAQKRDYGDPLTDELVSNLNAELAKRPYLSGLTLSGDDPLANSKGALALLKKLTIPKHNLWVYTGWTWEELFQRMDTDEALEDILSMTNVLVDGHFKKELADKTLQFRGSSNQRLILVQASLCYGNPVLYDEKEHEAKA